MLESMGRVADAKEHGQALGNTSWQVQLLLRKGKGLGLESPMPRTTASQRSPPARQQGGDVSTVSPTHVARMPGSNSVWLLI